MRQAILQGVCAMLIAAPALGSEANVKTPRADAGGVGGNWSGFYVGSHLSSNTGRSDWSVGNGVGQGLGGSIGLFDPFEAFKGTGSYALGLQAGFNLVRPSGWLIGVEADVVAPNTLQGSSDSIGLPGVSRSLQTTTRLSGTVRGRIGHAVAGWLPYATAGFAWSYDRLHWSDEVADRDERALLWRLGWAAGAGVEVPLAPAWSGRVEYLATGFGKEEVTFAASGERIESDLLVHSLRLGLNYRLGDNLANTDVFTRGVDALELDRFAFHGQTTFTWQYGLPFHAPYRGTNSLSPNHARQTWDTTLYVGAKLWEGAEFWINPEIDQGFGLSNTFGVAAFPSAESYKVGSDYPYARLTRYFVRQTVNLGEVTETVAGGPNQFAGKQSADRVVITTGKLSVGDIFDVNRYAHDPRVDFLNWGMVDISTFDYAADAWAFTYGGALEWYTGQWTLRAGLFDLPATPNSTNLDPTFNQFQVVGEIERRYNAWGQPGKIMVTGFVNRARLGRFDDAVRLGLLTGTTPSTEAVRRYTSKTGVSANLEQQLTADIGLFARAGLSSPNLETNAFTDADRSLAAGLSLSGRLWGRVDDTFGLAGLVHNISATRIAYLDAGGLTAIIGDGRLPHPGSERVLEAYYSLPVYSWRLTADYQYIANPAYNSDRGPVSIVATRLHTQF